MPDTTAANVLDPTTVLDQYFAEMRWRVLSLAADLDRVERLSGSQAVLSDRRLVALRAALAVLQDPQAGTSRAERVQMIFSDTSPPSGR